MSQQPNPCCLGAQGGSARPGLPRAEAGLKKGKQAGSLEEGALGAVQVSRNLSLARSAACSSKAENR